eukprot:6192756-Pleurochrysis_carterae.AAC.1
MLASAAYQEQLQEEQGKVGSLLVLAWGWCVSSRLACELRLRAPCALTQLLKCLALSLGIARECLIGVRRARDRMERGEEAPAISTRESAGSILEATTRGCGRRAACAAACPRAPSTSVGLAAATTRRLASVAAAACTAATVGEAGTAICTAGTGLMTTEVQDTGAAAACAVAAGGMTTGTAITAVKAGAIRKACAGGGAAGEGAMARAAAARATTTTG